MSGNQIEFWVDKWVPNLNLGHPIPLNGVNVDRDELVASVIHPVSRS